MDYQRAYGTRRGYHYCNPIMGWMSPAELDWLYHTAIGMDLIIETGSWHGRSAHALLSGTSGKVVCVDNFKGDIEKEGQEAPVAQTGSTLDSFLSNVGKFRNLEYIVGDALEFSRNYTGPDPDMVFLDDCHKYPHVKEEIELWLPRVKKILCGHDAFWVGVSGALLETIDPNSITCVQDIWIYDKRR